MARLKKNRIFKKKELINIARKLGLEIPENPSADVLFAIILDETGKPPFPPPPGDKP